MVTAFDEALTHEGALVTLDEAEMRVGAFVPPTRVGRAWSLGRTPLTGPVFEAAAQRLRERGLGSDETWVQEEFPGTVCPEGAWRAFIDHTEHFLGTPVTVILHRSDGTDEITRIVPGVHDGRPIASAELLVVPPDAGDDPLPVAIRLRAPAELTRELVDVAFQVPQGTLRIRYRDGAEEIDLADGAGRFTVKRRFGKPASVAVTADQVRGTLDRVLLQEFRQVSS